MSSFKMVPVVATEEMRAAALAAYEGATDSGEYATYPDSNIAAAMIAAAIAKAPPFVVTDEMAERMVNVFLGERAYIIKQAIKSDPEGAAIDKMRPADIAAMRAAIEAVLGGGA